MMKTTISMMVRTKREIQRRNHGCMEDMFGLEMEEYEEINSDKFADNDCRVNNSATNDENPCGNSSLSKNPFLEDFF
ncbi:hypothetical protein LguiA_032820 [Lonicera macranthoides]